MTRKDYEVIAVALAQAKAEIGRNDTGVNLCIEHISHVMQLDNPRFQPMKFKKYI